MPYIPNSPETLFEMVKAMGYSSFDELYDKAVPKRAQFSGCMGLPEALSEMEVHSLLSKLATKNTNTNQLVNFIGAGVYDHYVPAAVEKIAHRSEFYTAYTPYQAEVSQGTLSVIFEFQSMITALTGMDVANASVYDGGSGVAEAVNMAFAKTGRKRILLSKGINPLHRMVVETYTMGRGFELVDIPLDKTGRTDANALVQALEGGAGAFVLQSPNFYGVIEDGFLYSDMLKAKGAMFIASVDPVSLGMLTPPSEYGADIVVGEGQSLGNRMSFGGPLLGFFATRKENVRLMPGRIVGMTKDADGKDGLVLTYQTREQHIRREKATSNICSNQALLALSATIYLALMGDDGMKNVASLCFEKAHYLKDKLAGIQGVSVLYSAPFFREFAVKLPVKAADVVKNMAYRGFLAGADLGRFCKCHENDLLIAVTEKRTRQEMDDFASALADSLK